MNTPAHAIINLQVVSRKPDHAYDADGVLMGRADGTDTFSPRRISAAPSSSQVVIVSGGSRFCRSDNNPPIAIP